MLSRDEVKGRLMDRLDKQRASVDKDNKRSSTPARIAKLNVLDYLKNYLDEVHGYSLRGLEDVVAVNPTYDAGFFKSATKLILTDVIKFRAGEDEEHKFIYKS